MSAWNDSSLLVAMQTAFGTPNATDSDYQALLAEVPTVSFDTEITELELMSGQVGAAPERIVGRRSGTVSFSIPAEGLVTDYSPSNEDPGGVPVGNEVIPMWMNLLANAMGSNLSAATTNANFIRGLHCSTSQYTSGGMASGTASSIVCDDATASNKIDVGQLVVAALTDASTVPQIGWVKTKSSQTLTLFEAAVNNVNDAAANLYGTATAYMSSEVASTKALTFRWTGPNAALCYELIDAICESVKFSWNVGEVPTVEFSYKFYEFRINKLDGGLVVPDSYNRIPQIIGSVNGRVTMRDPATGLSGTSTCGIESAAWEWSATLRETKCHGSSTGIQSVEVINPRCKLTFSIPHDTADGVYDAAGVAANVGQHKWQSSLETGYRQSVGLYVGSQVGKIFSFLVPSGLITAGPQVADRDGTIAYTLEIEAATYSADTTDTAETSADSPLDSIARVGLA